MEAKLNQEQIQFFIDNGYVRINNAFSSELADEIRTILWKDIPANPDDPKTWTQPVVWLGMYNQPPFINAANTTVLHNAFDQLVGEGKWLPCMSMGSFPIRFPSGVDTGDTGWHVDASFTGHDTTDYFSARININSRGRALLMLFLFSNVSEKDAPTRILSGSHLDIARLLKDEGDTGLGFMELASRLPAFSERPQVLATGNAGTVYLCHPFLVHAAQPHLGTEPRFLAQPPLLLKSDFNIGGEGPFCPVEQAIRNALDY